MYPLALLVNIVHSIVNKVYSIQIEKPSTHHNLCLKHWREIEYKGGIDRLFHPGIPKFDPVWYA